MEAALLVAVAGTSFVLGRRAPVLPAAAGTAVLAVLAVALLDGNELVPAVLATAAPCLVGLELAARAGLVGQLEARNRELEAEEAAFTRLAVQRERARVARELHDVAAHHLAVVAVQAGAGRMAAPGGGRSRFADIRAAAVQALDELTRLTAMLDTEPSDLRSRLEGLYQRTRSVGLDVQAGPSPPVPGEMADTVFRIIQEALTNVIKHAPGATVEVVVEAGRDAVRVVVHDTGARRPSSLGASGAGAGVAGMRTRAEALGGRLDAGRVPGGWRVCAVLPTSAGVRQSAPAG